MVLRTEKDPREVELRDFLKDHEGKFHKEAPEASKITQIAFVGGIDCTIGSGSIDAKRLEETIRYLANSGFYIAPDFFVDVINLADGRDFLAEDKTYHMVILGYIFKLFGTVHDSSLERKSYEGGSTINSKSHTTAAWQQRIRSTKASAVISFGGPESEMTVNDACDYEFLPAIPAEEKAAFDKNADTLDRPRYSALSLSLNSWIAASKVVESHPGEFQTQLSQRLIPSKEDIDDTADSEQAGALAPGSTDR